MAATIAAVGFTITLKSLAMAARNWRSFSLGMGLNLVLALKPVIQMAFGAGFLCLTTRLERWFAHEAWVKALG